MKRFLLRLSLWSLVALAVPVTLAVSITLDEISHYRRSLVMPPGKDTVICCDSQSAFSLDPSVWTNLFNYSQGNATADEFPLKFADILAANPGRVKHLVVDVNLFQFYIQDLVSSMGASGVYDEHFLLHLLHPAETTRGFAGLADLFRRVIVINGVERRRKAWRRHRKHPYLLSGGFGSLADSGFLLHAEANAKLTAKRAHDVRTAAPITPDHPAFAAFSKMIARARANGVSVTFVSTPYHPSLTDAIGPERVGEYRRAVAVFLAREGCVWLDHSADRFPDAEWHDANHLNGAGARVFTARVMAEFREKTGSKTGD